jgi:hypothetical protein
MKEQENKKKEKINDNENIKSLYKKVIVQSDAIDFSTDDSQSNSITSKQKTNQENILNHQFSGNMKNTVVSTEVLTNIPNARAVRTIKARPLWKPNSAVLTAIETFRDLFISSGIKISKNSFFPPQVLYTCICIYIYIYMHIYIYIYIYIKISKNSFLPPQVLSIFFYFFFYSPI